MSINGYLMAGRINFIAAIFGVILTGILYWKLDIRKACSMLYDLPIKPNPAKPPRQPDTRKEKIGIVTVKCEEQPKTEILNRYETVCLYKQTFIHTSNIIE